MASIIKVDTIQDQDGNNIINESANTITIGASGDTITIPSGATLSTASFSSTGIDDNATSTAITIDSSNNVGIGTSSPVVEFEVATSGIPTLRLADTSVTNRRVDLSNSGGVAVLTARNDTANGGIFLQGGVGSAKYARFNPTLIQLYTNDSERMRIDSSGNVGIGTSSPSSALDVSGGLTVDGNDNNIQHNLTRQTATTNGSRPVIRLIAKNTASNVTDGFGSSIQFRMKDDTAETELGAIGYIRDGADGSGAFVVGQNSELLESSSQFIVKSNGNVGIGTTSPGAKLEVRGNVFTYDGGTQGISISSSGFVEIARTNGDAFIDFKTSTSEDFDVRIQQLSNGLIFYTGGNGSSSERMRITSSGNVGIGTSFPDSKLEISAINDGTEFEGLLLRNNAISNGTTTVLRFINSTSNTSDSNGGFIKLIRNGSNDNDLTFGTVDTERMRIDSSGTLKTNSTATQCAEFDRKSNDGNLVLFLRDAAVAGTISVSGGIVSYNAFTGSHWSRFTDNSKPTILKGTVLESLDEMCDWYNLEFDITDEEGNITSKKIPHVLTDTQSNGDVITYNHEGADYQATIVKETDIKHMKSKVSDTVDAKNVYGVFVAYDEDGEGYNDFYVASVGSFVVRIKANETIAKGDLLQSNGDGTAKVQTDDAVRSSSFAKVLSTTIIETYEDGSYLVPCSLMC